MICHFGYFADVPHFSLCNASISAIQLCPYLSPSDLPTTYANLCTLPLSMPPWAKFSVLLLPFLLMPIKLFDRAPARSAAGGMAALFNLSLCGVSFQGARVVVARCYRDRAQYLTFGPKSACDRLAMMVNT